jgi:hypothetical protein
MTIAQIKTRDHEIRRLKEGREKMIEKFIIDKCPFKVGELKYVTGYSYKGKRMKITRIDLKKGWCYGSDKNAYTYSFIYYGDILNKNGEVGKQYTSFEEEIKEV